MHYTDVTTTIAPMPTSSSQLRVNMTAVGNSTGCQFSNTDPSVNITEVSNLLMDDNYTTCYYLHNDNTLIVQLSFDILNEPNASHVQVHLVGNLCNSQFLNIFTGPCLTPSYDVGPCDTFIECVITPGVDNTCLADCQCQAVCETLYIRSQSPTWDPTRKQVSLCHLNII